MRVEDGGPRWDSGALLTARQPEAPSAIWSAAWLRRESQKLAAAQRRALALQARASFLGFSHLPCPYNLLAHHPTAVIACGRTREPPPLQNDPLARLFSAAPSAAHHHYHLHRLNPPLAHAQQRYPTSTQTYRSSGARSRPPKVPSCTRHRNPTWPPLCRPSPQRTT